MKKRLIFLILAMLLILSACGKEGITGPATAEISVYRLIRPEYRTGAELIQAEKIPYTDDTNIVRGVALILKSIPENQSLTSAIPEGVDILSAERVGRAVEITMSTSYGSLSGMNKTIADCCITLTMCSIPDVDYIYIRAGTDSGRERFSPEDIILSNTLINSTRSGIRLYFPKAGASVLAAEYRYIDLREDISAERAVIDELLKGPESDLLLPALPENTGVLSVYTLDGVCTVSFSEDFLSEFEGDLTLIRLAIYSVVNSLTCLSDVDSVMIIVQNNLDGQIGNISIAEPLVRKTTLIGAPITP